MKGRVQWSETGQCCVAVTVTLEGETPLESELLVAWERHLLETAGPRRSVDQIGDKIWATVIICRPEFDAIVQTGADPDVAV